MEGMNNHREVTAYVTIGDLELVVEGTADVDLTCHPAIAENPVVTYCREDCRDGEEYHAEDFTEAQLERIHDAICDAAIEDALDDDTDQCVEPQYSAEADA